MLLIGLQEEVLFALQAITSNCYLTYNLVNAGGTVSRKKCHVFVVIKGLMKG